MPQALIESTLRLEHVALRWRAIAEQRRDYFRELHQTGRWRHYYGDESFFGAMREAVEMAERWALIVPRPEEREAPAVHTDGPLTPATGMEAAADPPAPAEEIEAAAARADDGPELPEWLKVFAADTEDPRAPPGEIDAAAAIRAADPDDEPPGGDVALPPAA